MENNKMTNPMNKEVSDYINNAPAEQQDIMTQIRTLIHECVQNVSEEFKWSRPVFKHHKHFAYLQANKNHVNLGFIDFHKLNDPNELLQGTGKDMRHIKLRKAADIDIKLLTEWFKAVTTA